MHQGAQCDRASLALNYYHNGMRFLYPEVHENRCRDGIVSCELPLSNYLTATLYKILGFHERWFRLLTFAFITLGMFFLFQLFRLFVKPPVACLLVFIINASPIVLFYNVNFIPDASALGLVLLSWYLFFRLFIPHPYLPNLKNRSYPIIFILSLSLAMASKSTCVIQWMSMCVLLALSTIRFLRIELVNRKGLLFSLVTALIIPVLWQLWARHLGEKHNSEFFMLHIPLPDSLLQFKEAWHVYLSNWPQETFATPLYPITGILLLAPVFLKRFIQPNLWYLTLINTSGSFLFMAVMIKQFMYHDYYILCLLPAIIINWIAVASAMVKLKPEFWWLKIALFLALIWAAMFQFRYGKTGLASRYTPGNYWEQSQQNTEDYRRFKNRINRLGVDRNQCVLVGYDGAPNNVLYLLDLNGKRINRDFSDEQIKESLVNFNPTYLISNDSVFAKAIRPYFKELTPVAKDKYLALFKIGY